MDHDQVQMDVLPKTARKAAWESCEPPKYTIDLSLPPRQRYRTLAQDFKDDVKTLPFLFDEVVAGHFPQAYLESIRKLAKVLLRGIHDKEENEELKGIHEVTGIEMYLLVAFNVLLDLFMGCTSGGVGVADAQGSKRMLHFRTLDWGMPALRKVIVHLDFVGKPGGPVIASSITYAGYVGVLTGVRQGMSMSLNFRPTHDASTRLANFRFYFNHVLVLLGLRPSISSILRQCLLPSTKQGRVLSNNLKSVEKHLPNTKTTAAYLIFSDGYRTMTMEKDHKTADIRSSADFIVTTNHDVAEEGKSQSEKQESDGNASSRVQQATGMEVLVEESTSRKACMVRLYEKARKRSLDRRSSRKNASDARVTEDQVVEWMNKYPIKNEETHYATVMDPQRGETLWTRVYPEEMTKEMIDDASRKIVRGFL